MKSSFYRDQTCIEKSLSILREWTLWCYHEKQTSRWLRISKSERKNYLSGDSKNCCICGENAENSTRVIHHCHSTGEIFGMAHSKCNLRARSTDLTPICFHSFSRYDSQQILKNLQLKPGEKFSAILTTYETYTSVSIAVPVGSHKHKRNRKVSIYHSLRFLTIYASNP